MGSNHYNTAIENGYLFLHDATLDFSNREPIEEIPNGIDENELLNRLVGFIARNKKHLSNGKYTQMDGKCEWCGIDNVFTVWDMPIFEAGIDDEENALYHDWQHTMGMFYDWTQEYIQIFNCNTCGHWEITNDG